MKNLKICVCIKQVPDTQKVKIDPVKGTMIRKGVPSIMNPYDESALEMALEIKDMVGGEITTISMGIPSVANMLRYTIALGADRTFLLTSPEFAGADTLATSYTLSLGIAETGPYDLILFGKQAIDGDTAQVGPEVASALNMPLVTYISNFFEIDNDGLKVERFTDYSREIVKAKFPSVITVLKAKSRLRMPKLSQLIHSFDVEIPFLNAKRLKADINRCGLKGSPTRVKEIFSPKLDKKVIFIDGSINEKAEKFKDILKDLRII